jgi:hypothetical protein
MRRRKVCRFESDRGGASQESAMCEAFDQLPNVDTWQTGHVFDLDRFNHALAKVVRDPNFNAIQMPTACSLRCAFQ